MNANNLPRKLHDTLEAAARISKRGQAVTNQLVAKELGHSIHLVRNRISQMRGLKTWPYDYRGNPVQQHQHNNSPPPLVTTKEVALNEINFMDDFLSKFSRFEELSRVRMWLYIKSVVESKFILTKTIK